MSRKTIIILTILLMALLTSSCQTETISQTQLQLARYSLKIGDLPSDWKFEGKNWSVDFGGESYTVTYQLDMHVFISHTVSIHSSEAQAQQAYKEWEANWFNLVNLQPDKSYSPSDKDDDYRYECEQIPPGDPLIVCMYLQRHNEMINFVKINLDNRSKNNPTFAEINDILGILDERLNEVAIDAKPEGDTP